MHSVPPSPVHAFAKWMKWLDRSGRCIGRPHACKSEGGASTTRNRRCLQANLFAALCASRRGDVLSAVELLGRAHAVAPHNAEIVRDYGAILFRANRTAEAVPPPHIDCRHPG